MSVYKCSFRIYIIFYHRRPFNKTAATLVRPHPFSTLCTTPLGKMTLCLWMAPNNDSDKDVMSLLPHCILLPMKMYMSAMLPVLDWAGARAHPDILYTIARHNTVHHQPATSTSTPYRVTPKITRYGEVVWTNNCVGHILCLCENLLLLDIYACTIDTLLDLCRYIIVIMFM